MKRFYIFAHAKNDTPLTGEWRNVGHFEAPHDDAARVIAWHQMELSPWSRVRVFTANATNSCTGRMVADMSYSDSPAVTA